MSYRHFTLIGAGDVDELLPKYDSTKNKEKVLKYKAKDIDKLYKERKKILQGLAATFARDQYKKEYYKEEMEYHNEIDPLEYYVELTENLDIDPETGDAYAMENPNGRYNICGIGGVFAIPFKKKNGEESYKAKKLEVDWPKMHYANKEVYAVAWELVMEGRKPENDNERHIYDNMKNRTHYFETFRTKERYVEFCTAFWGYAFLSPETGWVELDDSTDQFEWVNTFYDRFIRPLPDDTELTIYECVRNDEETSNV